MIKRIQVRDLEPGMFICDMNTPWIRHPYVPNRVLLKQAKDIDLMLGLARTKGVPMPLTALTRQLMQMLVGAGFTAQGFDIQSETNDQGGQDRDGRQRDQFLLSRGC